MQQIILIIQSKDFYETIIVGIVGGAVLKAGEFLYVGLRDLFFAYRTFSIGGVWAAEFESYIKGKFNLEFMYIAQHRHEIKFTLLQFSNRTAVIRKFRGTGVVRGASVSAIYYSADKDSIQHGVLALTISQQAGGETALLGRFAELEMGSERNQIISSDAPYVLRRVSLGLVQRLKLKFGFRCFKNFEQAKAAIKSPLGS
jgi:hypothetical protein